jgi:hypothetical protein
MGCDAAVKSPPQSRIRSQGFSNFNRNYLPTLLLSLARQGWGGKLRYLILFFKTQKNIKSWRRSNTHCFAHHLNAMPFNILNYDI